MTQTAQILSQWNTVKIEKPALTENEEIMGDILAVCDSMHKLCETLGRLDYVLQRKKIEHSLQRRFI